MSQIPLFRLGDHLPNRTSGEIESITPLPTSRWKGLTQIQGPARQAPRARQPCGRRAAPRRVRMNSSWRIIAAHVEQPDQGVILRWRTDESPRCPSATPPSFCGAGNKAGRQPEVRLKPHHMQFRGNDVFIHCFTIACPSLTQREDDRLVGKAE